MCGIKRKSKGDMLVRKFKRVLRSKPANYNFPMKVIEQVYADREKMTPQEKAKQTRFLSSYAKDRYKKLYQETTVTYEEIDYTVKQWRTIPKVMREELTQDLGKWTKEKQLESIKDRFKYDEISDQYYDSYTGEIFDSQPQSAGRIAYENFVDEFLERLQTETPSTYTYKGKERKRWSALNEASEKAKWNLKSIVEREVEKYGKDEVGRRLASHYEEISASVDYVLYGSNLTTINQAYTEIVYVITNGDIFSDELEDIEEQAELNGVYN